MGLLDKYNPRDLFENSRNNNLDAYFASLRDLVDRSPMIPTRARDTDKLDVFSLQEISSKLNRYHVSGNKDSIGDILKNMFPENEKKDHLDLLVRILVDGCNRKVKEELGDMVALLNVDAPGTATHFQSFAEAMQEVIRLRLKENH